MELKNLVGEHWLDAVDYSTEQIADPYGRDEAANVMRFRLDGVTYAAIEDPSDGYRSCLKDLEVQPAAVLKNVFPPVRVLGSHRTRGRHYDKDDVLELRAVSNGGLVLEVGTESADDYYPSFVASFHPEVFN